MSWFTQMTKEGLAPAVVKDLEGGISKTLIGSTEGYMHKYISNYLKNSGDNIVLVDTPAWVDEVKGLGDALKGLYEKYIKIPRSGINQNVELCQAALMDGPVFVYNTDTGVLEGLFTTNFELFGGNVKLDNSKLIENILNYNKNDCVYGLEIKAIYDGRGTQVKLEVKKRNISINVGKNGNYAIIPYVNIKAYTDLVSKCMENGLVLRVVQNFSGQKKVRFITEVKRILAKYCDDPSAVEPIHAMYRPLNALFYAPSIGSPSITMMVTKVFITDLVSISKINSEQELVAGGVKKATDPVRMLVVESVIENKLIELDTNNLSIKNTDIYNKLPHKEFFDSISVESAASSKTISNYLHSITNDEVIQIAKMLPGAVDEIKEKYQVFGKARPITETELYDIKGTLEQHICRFIIRKKDGSMYAVCGTNSSRILSRIYGNDYYSIYESEGNRVRKALYQITSGVSTKDAINSNKLNSLVADSDNVVATLKEYLEKQKGKTVNNNMVTLRTLGARILESKGDKLGYYHFDNPDSVSIENYYSHFDENKIIKGFVLS